VKELFENAMRLTKRNKKGKTKLTLRDAVVLLMVNNVFQKAFFSDGGDDLHNFFAHCVDDIEGLGVEEVRTNLLKTAKGL